MLRLSRILLALLAALTAGCAYRAVQFDRQLPGGYQRISVPMFRNSTPEPGIEVFFTNEMVRELANSPKVRVRSSNEAEVTLHGEITSLEYLIIGSSTDGFPSGSQLDLATNYRVHVGVNLRLVRNSDSRVLWTGRFDGERSYAPPRVLLQGLTSVNSLYNHSARRDVISTIAADLMAEAFDQMTENF